MSKPLPTISKFSKDKGITPLKSGFQKKVHLVAFDTETINNGNLYIENKTVLAQIKTSSSSAKLIYFPKPSLDNLKYFVNPNRKVTLCTAHNLEFDFVSLFGNEATKQLMAGNPVNGWKGRVNFGFGKSNVQISNGCNTIYFLDTATLFGGSLETLTERKVNYMRKGNKPSYLGVRLPDSPKELLEFEQYSQQDVEIQYELTKKIANSFKDLNIPIRQTVSSIGGTMFRKNYLKKPMPLISDEFSLALIYDSCIGGRWEAFGRGSFENVRQFDVNSNYPFVATTTPLNMVGEYYKNMPIDGYLDKENFGFLKVAFKYPEDTVYPSLPVKHYSKKGDYSKYSIIYPLEGESVCTSMELIEAEKAGCVFNVIEDWGWTPTDYDWDNPIKHFMEDCYLKRKENKDNLFDYKKIMNFVIGRFAQKYEKDGVLTAGSMFRPDISAMIWGASRVMASGLVEDSQALYLGCDCVITKKKLKTGVKLGQLKDVYDGKKVTATIIKNRFYLVDNEGCISGGTHGCVKNPTFVLNNLKQMGTASKLSYDRNSMVSFKLAARQDTQPHKWRKTLSTMDIAPDGKRQYFSELKTADDLLNYNTFSKPL